MNSEQEAYEKTNTTSVKKWSPIQRWHAYIWGRKKAPTNQPQTLTKWNAACMAEDDSEGDGQQKKQSKRTLHVTSPEPLISHIFNMLL